MIDQGKRDVLGVYVDAVDYEASVERILSAARGRRSMAVSALAVHGVMTGVTDRSHRYRLNRFDLLVPDGQPVRWALRWLHRVKLPDRVYGPNLMLKICKRAAEEKKPVFFFGGTQPMLDALQANLKNRFPALQIAGAQASRFRRLSPDERDQLVRTIRKSGARITFVGLGCPRQEVWAYEFCDTLSMPVVAVGAAFSFHAGMLPQAPSVLQKRGLEWFYRLIQEPRRLWRRYLFLNPMYLTLLLLQWTRLRRPQPGDSERPTEELLYG